MKNINSVCPYAEEIECSRVNSCNYMINRFGIMDCTPDKIKKEIVDKVHKAELKEREELLKSDNYHTGENYNKDIDLTYKDTIINPEEERKKEC